MKYMFVIAQLIAGKYCYFVHYINCKYLFLNWKIWDFCWYRANAEYSY